MLFHIRAANRAPGAILRGRGGRWRRGRSAFAPELGWEQTARESGGARSSRETTAPMPPTTLTSGGGMRVLPWFLTLAVAFSLAGCATAPKQFTFDPVVTIDASFDDVWSAVVEFFAVGTLPIETIEKDSGLIVTSWMDATEEQGYVDDRWCSCGSEFLSPEDWTRGKFNIFAKSLGPNSTQLRVTCLYQQARGGLGSGIVTCNSNGSLEAAIQRYVAVKVTGGTPVAPPSFRPGNSE
jgi:hypothetical protein